MCVRDLLILDTSVLLAGKEPPPGRWTTTPEAEAEIRPGGRDARRLAFWKETGLQIRSAGRPAWVAVDETAGKAGNLGRLSAADRSLLALAVETGGTLVTDDHTMLDVAKRLRLTTQTVSTDGIKDTKQWRPRCSGCGRWFDEDPGDCPVCGSPVKLKPAK